MKTLKNLTKTHARYTDLSEADANLFGLFELLFNIDRRLRREAREREKENGNNVIAQKEIEEV